ncbi:MAG: hypothetical protein JWL61_676, partial [Gemmatimonadetes bacterium]|nr:hypothetical protein [Gemmatimonadota bacterium]
MYSRLNSSTLLAFAAIAALLAACSDNITEPNENVVCDSANGGITLPSGFCATVVADLKTDGQP